MTKPSTAIDVSEASSVCLEVAPNPAFVDEKMSIFVRGLMPGAPGTLRAKTHDDYEREWTSEARFVADATGAIGVSSCESLGGTYRGISRMGLFWSMLLSESQRGGRSTFAKKDVTPNHVMIEVKAEGGMVGSSSLERRYLEPGAVTRDLKVPGESQDETGKSAEYAIGRLFIPGGRRPGERVPAVVILSGSGGGFDLDKAALLARHGFATLALAYFGMPPLPTWLHHIPLEYFEAAFEWLMAQPEIDAERIGIFAVSRGAELALLLGSKFPLIRAIVAYAPSHVAWAAGSRDKRSGEIPPSWTHGGAALPFVPLPLRQFIFRSAVPVALLKRPVMFRELFRAGLRYSKAVPEAEIAVEKIGGPILLISGGDDHLWPADEMSERIMSRLKKHYFGHRVEHLHYPKAGHMLRYPYLPTTVRDSTNPHLRNARYSLGGTAPADAEAQEDSWRYAIAFLKSSLF